MADYYNHASLTVGWWVQASIPSGWWMYSYPAAIPTDFSPTNRYMCTFPSEILYKSNYTWYPICDLRLRTSTVYSYSFYSAFYTCYIIYLAGTIHACFIASFPGTLLWWFSLAVWQKEYAGGRIEPSSCPAYSKIRDLNKFVCVILRKVQNIESQEL